ncbi:MAG: glycosyltransferase family 9 protein [Phycisphaerales bacterium]
MAEVARACDGVDLAARGVTLGALVGVLADAALLVTNDTGPRHIAIGVATPVVALFGPTDHRFTAIPGARERRLLAEPFLPEEAVADRRPEACRIDRIEVGDVVHASHVLLDRGRSAAKGAP